MAGHRQPRADGDPHHSRLPLRGKIMRYAAGSVIAAVCSEAMFLLLYGAFHAAPAIASSIGWLAGVIPNYWLNRSWAWQRRGRPSLTREILPYVAIILATLVVAAVSTSLVHDALAGADVSSGVRLVLVGGTFLAVYGVIFLLRFFLLDQLFRRAPSGSTSPNATATSTRETV